MVDGHELMQSEDVEQMEATVNGKRYVIAKSISAQIRANELKEQEVHEQKVSNILKEKEIDVRTSWRKTLVMLFTVSVILLILLYFKLDSMNVVSRTLDTCMG